MRGPASAGSEIDASCPRDGLARFTSAMTPMPGSRSAAITSSGGGAAFGGCLDLGEADDGFASGNVGADSLDDGVEHGCRTHARRLPSSRTRDVAIVHRRVAATDSTVRHRPSVSPDCWSGHGPRRARPRSSAPTSSCRCSSSPRRARAPARGRSYFVGRPAAPVDGRPHQQHRGDERAHRGHQREHGAPVVPLRCRPGRATGTSREVGGRGPRRRGSPTG